MKLLMLIVMFFCVGAFFIISENNLALNKQENIDNFVSLYGNWLKSTAINVGSLTGHIVKMEWLPKE